MPTSFQVSYQIQAVTSPSGGIGSGSASGSASGYGPQNITIPPTPLGINIIELPYFKPSADSLYSYAAMVTGFASGTNGWGTEPVPPKLWIQMPSDYNPGGGGGATTLPGVSGWFTAQVFLWVRGGGDYNP
jgi:hypothetical protein